MTAIDFGAKGYIILLPSWLVVPVWSQCQAIRLSFPIEGLYVLHPWHPVGNATEDVVNSGSGEALIESSETRDASLAFPVTFDNSTVFTKS